MEKIFALNAIKNGIILATAQLVLFADKKFRKLTVGDYNLINVNIVIKVFINNKFQQIGDQGKNTFLEKYLCAGNVFRDFVTPVVENKDIYMVNIMYVKSANRKRKKIL